MVLWLFLLICELICPVGMILFGWGFMTHPMGKGLKHQRAFYRQQGKRWAVIGGVVLAATVAAQALLLGKAPVVLGIAGSVLVLLQTLVMLATVLPARRVMKTFSE